MKNLYFLSAICLVFFSKPLFSQQVLPQGTIQLRPEEIEWKDGNPNLPPGAKTAVLEGNPKQEGIFTMRVYLPPGAVLKPHTHPREERVTVLEGIVRVAFSETVDWTKGTAFGPGSYYVNPPGAAHLVWTNEGALVQITGIGPWEIHFK